MATTAAGEKHLRWCADRALLEFDHGGADEALASVTSDFTRSELTENIDPFIVRMVVVVAAKKGRDSLEKAIMDFKV